MKKFLLTLMACALFFSFSGLTMAAEVKKASPDDMKWIAQCIIDNKDEGQPMEVVQKYCECMNSKMDENETQSVTQWEKTHPQERKECSDKAGWK